MTLPVPADQNAEKADPLLWLDDLVFVPLLRLPWREDVKDAEK